MQGMLKLTNRRPRGGNTEDPTSDQAVDFCHSGWRTNPWRRRILPFLCRPQIIESTQVINLILPNCMLELELFAYHNIYIYIYKCICMACINIDDIQYCVRHTEKSMIIKNVPTWLVVQINSCWMVFATSWAPS